MKKLFDLSYIQKTVLENPGNFRLFIFICIGIRLLFFISDGHNSDFDFFEHWGDRMAHQGFLNIYSIKVDRFECDYPPLYLYLIYPVAQLFYLFDWDIHTHAYDSFLKLYNLLFELGFIWLFYRHTKNILFFAIMLLSPVSILNAYGWGQIDILYSILIFLSFYFLFEKEFYKAAIVLGLSMALKTQTILFLPLIALLFLGKKELLQVKINSLFLLIIVYLIPNVPFILWAPNPLDSIQPHLTAAGRYNNITVNAFNFYWTFFADFNLKMQLKFPANDVMIFGLITRKVLAYTLFFISFAWIVLQYIKHMDNHKKMFMIISFFCFSYFMFLPEMHERYLFPMFIFSAYVCSYDKKEWPFFIILSIIHCINLLWGWGEQKFVKTQWIFELTRIVSLLSTITYLFYAYSVNKRLKENEN